METIFDVNLMPTTMIKLLFTPLLCLVALAGTGQNYSAISDAFSAGNAAGLAKIFDAAVEISVAGKEETLRKSEAEGRLRSFFLEHTPKGFSIVHQGVSQNDIHYLIGQLSTSSGTYRVTVYLHNTGEEYFIQSLEIEES